MDYVLGFGFDHHGRVALIQKQRPNWQKGKWNGVGGKVEPNEKSTDAMHREFLEETGVDIPANEWEVLGAIRGIFGRVIIFVARNPAVAGVATQTDEFVSLFTPWGLPNRCLNNVPALVSIACIQDELHGRPKIVLLYDDDPPVDVGAIVRETP